MPSQEAFDNLKKDDLLSLGKHLKLEVKKLMRKDLIQHIIMKYMISLKIFDGSVLESLVSSDVEIRKLEIDLELKKIDAQRERESRELEFREREKKGEIEKQRLDHELEMKKLALQMKLGSTDFVTSTSVKFDVSKYIKLVQPFHESDVDKNFSILKRLLRISNGLNSTGLSYYKVYL